MEGNIVIKQLADLDADEWLWCERNVLSPAGGMADRIKVATSINRRLLKKIWVLFSYTPDGILSGWAMVEDNDFMVFVNKSFRRQGVGKHLLLAARSRFGEKLRYYPFDAAGKSLFAKYGGHG